jgi:excinuclease UvrABC helicase subunit UvrB
VSKTASVAQQVAQRKTSDPEQEIKRLRKQMKAAASKLEFERAAEIRDLIRELQALIVGA